jgi:urea carboxylase-associated protein 1
MPLDVARPAAIEVNRHSYGEIKAAGQRDAARTLAYKTGPEEMPISESAVVQALLNHTVPAEEPWPCVVRPGEILRIVDLEGPQAVDTLFCDAQNHSEHYSAQDRVRVQRSPYVSAGLMLRLTEDSRGGHGTSASARSCESNPARFGRHTNYGPACREEFVLEVSKYGMSKRDIVPNINCFMNVPIPPGGELAVVDRLSKPGDHVELIAEMDVPCAISNYPQDNNPCYGLKPAPIQVLIWVPPEGLKFSRKY